MNDRHSEASVTVGAIAALSLILVLLTIAGAAFWLYRSTMLRQQEAMARAIAEKQQQMSNQMVEKLAESLAESVRKGALPLRILARNIESGGNDPVVIAEQLAELKGYDIYALSELPASNVKRYVKALDEANQSSFRFMVSQTGNDDRLAVLFVSVRVTLV